MKIIQHRLFLEENCVIVHLKKLGRTIILLNNECPQISKPKANATVREPELIRDRTEKPSAEPRLGLSSPPANQ